MSREFDFERAAALLDIVEKVSKVAPGYTAISAEAMAELRQLNQWLIEEQAKRKAVELRKQNEELAKRAAEQETDRKRQEAEDEKRAKANAVVQPPNIIPGQPVPGTPVPSQPIEQVTPSVPIEPTPNSPPYQGLSDGAAEPVPVIERTL